MQMFNQFPDLYQARMRDEGNEEMIEIKRV